MPETKLPWYETPSLRFRALRLLPRNAIGDRLFALALFRHWHGRWPRRSGGTINDVLFRLKTSAEIARPLRVYVSDKEYLKDYVRAKLGEAFNVPTLACLRGLESVRRFAFPPRCVIKPTHLSGAVIMRKAGEAIDLGALERWLGTDLYDHSRERNYRALRPKIIVEDFAFDLEWPTQFKIYCCAGEPRLIMMGIGSMREGTRGFYDGAWNPQPIYLQKRNHAVHPRPANLDLIRHAARSLSAEFASGGELSFIRVDLYANESEVKVSELTNCPYNAGIAFTSPEGERLATRLVFGRD